MFSFLNNDKIDIVKNATTPCIVAGNAPSLKEIDYARLPLCRGFSSDFADSADSMNFSDSKKAKNAIDSKKYLDSMESKKLADSMESANSKNSKNSMDSICPPPLHIDFKGVRYV